MENIADRVDLSRLTNFDGVRGLSAHVKGTVGKDANGNYTNLEWATFSMDEGRDSIYDGKAIKQRTIDRDTVTLLQVLNIPINIARTVVSDIGHSNLGNFIAFASPMIDYVIDSLTNGSYQKVLLDFDAVRLGVKKTDVAGAAPDLNFGRNHGLYAPSPDFGIVITYLPEHQPK